MPKVSLDDLRSGGASVVLPERAYPLCIRRDLLAEVDRLQDALAQAVTTRGENAPPMRKGEAPSPDEAKVRKELERVLGDVDDNTAELLIRAIPDGHWRQFVNEHPAREENARDEQVTYGIVDADALVEDLGRWVVSWGGDKLNGEEWRDLFAPRLSGGDLKSIASLIVQMQEVSEDPKWRLRALLGARGNSDADPSPEQ